MEKSTTSVEDLFEKLKDYIDTRVDLFKLKSIDKVSRFFSGLVAALVLLIVAQLVLVCITIALALLLGAWLGNTYLGFFVIAGIYIIIGLILYSSRDRFLRKPISNKLLKELLD